MPDRLERLFSYSRSTERDALENFTIEALAVAIEDDVRWPGRMTRRRMEA